MKDVVADTVVIIFLSMEMAAVDASESGLGRYGRGLLEGGDEGVMAAALGCGVCDLGRCGLWGCIFLGVVVVECVA